MTRIGDETVHGFTSGRKSAIGASAVQLVSASSHLTKGVQIKAPDTNSGVVYVGNSGVTADAADATDGFPLAAGEGLFVPGDDPSKIYVIASAAGQKVFWFAI